MAQNSFIPKGFTPPSELGEGEIARLEENFRMFDKDGDGEWKERPNACP